MHLLRTQGTYSLNVSTTEEGPEAVIKNKPCDCKDEEYTKEVKKLDFGAVVFACEHGNTITASQYEVERRATAKAMKEAFGQIYGGI